MSNKAFTLSYRKIILFFLYITPWIDVWNSSFGKEFSIGQFVRGLMIAFNIILLVKVAAKSREVLNVLGIIFYCMLQTIFCLFITSNESVGINIAYFLKFMLFTTECNVLTMGYKSGFVREEDLIRFWKYSLFVTPALLIISNILKLGTKGRAGFYSSANAMSIILIIQVLLSVWFLRERKQYLLIALLNLSALVILGTKSPLLILVASFVLIMLFYSKHRIKLIITILSSAILLYFVATHFFSSQVEAILNYQLYHLNYSLKTNSVETFIFSGRNNLLKDTIEVLNKRGLIFFATIFGVSPYGLGRITAAVYGLSSVRGIELDFLEILLYYGVFVTIGVYSIFFKALFARGSNKTYELFLNVAIIASLTYGVLGGHGITEGISATYCGILVATKNIYAIKSKA